jgi:hypothetical protein
MRFRSLPFAAVAAIAIAAPAWAHHSHANYKTDQFLNLSGTIKEVQWMNPHVWLYLTVAEQPGQQKVWALEGGSVAALMRGGWQKDTIKPGDKITVRCHHLRDESDGCLLGFVTSINGTAMDKEFD